METAKHTPGKWETGSLMTQVVVWPDGWNAPLCIADCHAKNAPTPEEERCANARLIAAAPEMLEAIRHALPLSIYRPLPDGVDETYWESVFERLFAAMQKAIGDE